ncbi:ATP-binding protein [Polyangium aurulentum]|uniref:hybrid sensor histidine kinase/response regulator n=1 Tax=Polyangium aurulentum TaxID=2567896 RepID=UPI00146C74B5|nr:ATP-binding protein [Polyangium aurulentum]UQA62057.1 response regulator [Polyangium aurulentum]
MSDVEVNAEVLVHDLTLGLDEVQDTLSAIRNGEVDALVIASDEEPRVFVLKGADRTHSVLFETLNESAMTIAADGSILFANRRFSELIGKPQEGVLGVPLWRFVAPEDAAILEELLAHGQQGSAKGELSFLRSDGQRVPVMLSMSAVAGSDGFCTVVLTDLTPLKDAHAALKRAHDELEARVEARTAELLQVNEALRAEITMRERLEHELRRKAEELVEADRRKDEFLSMLAHELRNPLAPIFTAVEMLRLVTRGEPPTERFRSVIERQVRNLTRLVDDLLDVSRITRRSITLRKQYVDLGAVVRSATDAARTLIDASGHTLEVDMPAMPVIAFVDPTRFEQVLVNLLNNAAKYTERGGKIRLAIECHGEQLEVSVRDTGVGLPADLLPRVFDLFVQGERSLDRSQGGLGIGLTMVKSLVEMHDGTVEARSEGVGLGSEFVIRVPLSPRDAVQGTAVQAPSAAQIVEPEAGAPSRRVLVVEDNPDSAETLSSLLTAWGYDVRFVETGEDALRLVGTFQPHAVLVDIGLPGMDGYEVARKLRDSVPDSVPSRVLIGITGYGQEQDRRLAHEAGIDHHLVKPPDPAALRELLERSIQVASSPQQAVAG